MDSRSLRSPRYRLLALSLDRLFLSILAIIVKDIHKRKVILHLESSFSSSFIFFGQLYKTIGFKTLQFEFSISIWLK